MEVNIIFSKFLNLKSEKQERILNAAMKEFAQKGFKNASTDAIVKEADISKGALFYYFKNKKALFLFLYDYNIDILKNEIQMKLNDEEKDIFVRRRQAALFKIGILNKYPEMYNFIKVAYLEDSIEVKSDLESRNKELIASSQAILSEGIDTSRFKEGVDIKSAIDIITWTFDGFMNREFEKIRLLPLYEIDMYGLLKEMNIYMDMLKKSFYK